MTNKPEEWSAESHDLALRVVRENRPLSMIEIDTTGPELGFLMREVQLRAERALSKIEEACKAKNQAVLIPVFQAYITRLFGSRGSQTNEEDEEDEEDVPQRLSGLPLVQTPSGHLVTQERRDRELLLLGHVYIYMPDQTFLSKVKLEVERVFIEECRNVHQQRKVLELVAQMSEKDLTHVDTMGNMVVFLLNDDLFQNLKVSALLNDEDRHNSGSSLKAFPTGGKSSQYSMTAQTKSGKGKSSGSINVEKLNLDWDPDDTF